MNCELGIVIFTVYKKFGCGIVLPQSEQNFLDMKRSFCFMWTHKLILDIMAKLSPYCAYGRRLYSESSYLIDTDK